MKCKICDADIFEDYNGCPYCLTTFEKNNRDININTGKKSINIDIGNLPNARIHVGDNYDLNKEPTSNIKINSDYKFPIKPIWMAFLGLVGFIGSIASIISALKDGLFTNTDISFLPHIIILISFLLLFIGFTFLFKNFIWLQLFGLRKDSNGYIHIITLKGKCPICTNVTKVKYYGAEGNKALRSICIENSEGHNFVFDHTELR
ncbi:hypothetical protein MNBD_GAMMA07-2444 [hydrothermal vent metagenome]|uniref:Uncharacterized protein n=1 Tax=hydrothermal vent metagenome TaxID=652676 RepID=A0A3B0XJK5_9ZZZZ